MSNTFIRPKKVALCTVMLFGITSISMAPAVAVEEPIVIDTEAPVLESYEVTSKLIDGRNGGSVTATIHVTDDTCTETPVVTVTNAADNTYDMDPDNPFNVAMDVELVSGTCQDGIYKATGEILAEDFGSQPFGTWTTTLFPLSDTLGNSAGLDSNSFFEDRPFTYAVTPASPANVKVQTATVSGVAATWDIPNNHGSKIDHYVGSVRNATKDTVVDTFETKTNSCDVCQVDLDAGQTYDLSVVAVNGVGESTAGVSSEFAVDADTTAPVVTASPQSGAYSLGQMIELSADEQADIYFTLDGSVPTPDSKLYDEPLKLTDDTELRFIGVDAAGNSSAIVTNSYAIELLTMTAVAPSVTGDTTVGNILTADVGAWEPAPIELSYQWNRDGASIDGANESTYKLVAEDEGAVMTVTVTGVKDGYRSEALTSEPTVEIVGVDSTAPEVIPSLKEGKYIYGSEIDLEANEDAKIYYTVDGSEPTEESALFEEPIVIEGWFELKYFAVDGAENASETQSAIYTLDFTDVFEGTDEKPGTMYYEAIQWAVKAGITNGYKEDGVFKPYSPINRDAMAAFMYRLAGEPEFVAPEESPFVDYNSNNEFYKEVTWLESKNISNGWTDNEADTTAEYRPFQPINRDAMAAFVYRFAAMEGDRFEGPVADYTGLAESYFVDYDADNEFYDEVSWLYEQEITTGWTVGDTTEYRPFTPITRDAIAVFLQRLADEVPAEDAPAGDETPVIGTDSK